MNLQQATVIARTEMDKFGLQDWTLDINYSMRTTFGRCNVLTKTISLSAVLISLNDEHQVLDTTRHEIAHATREAERGNPSNLTAGMWHDPRWQQIAAQIGSTPKQFYNSPGSRPVKTGRVHVKNAWRMTCPNCNSTGTTMRKSKKACCARCVRTTGQYFHWVYTPNN